MRNYPMQNAELKGAHSAFYILRSAFRSILHSAFLLGTLLLAPRLFAFAEVAWSLVAWPWQFDYDEGINLNAAVQLAEGRNIYRSNGPGEFISAPYTPFLYLLLAPLTWVAGPELWTGRALSLLSTLAIAALIFWIVRRVTGGLWWAGVFAGALWLSLSPVIVWSSLYKQDMPALALGLGGLALALRSADYRLLTTDYRLPSKDGEPLSTQYSVLSTGEGARYWLVGPAILFALAFYTKQSALAAAAATTLWLLLRDWRVGLRFLAMLTVLIPILFLLANEILRGGLWEHVVGNHALTWSFGQIERTWGRLWGEYWPLLLWGGAALIGALLLLIYRMQRNAERRMQNAELDSPYSTFCILRSAFSAPAALPLLYALVGGASAFVQMGYVTGNHNHALDGVLPLCILAGQSAGWLIRQYRAPSTEFRVKTRNHFVLCTLCFVLMAVAFGAQLFLYAAPRTWYRGGWPSRELHADMENLSRLVRDTRGDIYSEDATLLLRNGKRVLYDDPSTFVPLAELDVWDDTLFNQSLRNRRFPIILLQRGSGRMTAEGREAFEASYRLKFSSLINTYEALLDPPQPQFTLGCDFRGEADSIALKGYALGPGVAESGIAPGTTLRVTLYWQPQSPPTRPYASYVHAANERGERLAGQDNPQTGADAPTPQWPLDALTKDSLSIPLPNGLPPGKYRLIAGMYSVQDGGIIPLSPTCPMGDLYGAAVSLGWVDVR